MQARFGETVVTESGDEGLSMGRTTVPGMDTATCYEQGASDSAAEAGHDVFRIGANDWGLMVAALEVREAGPDARVGELTGALRALAPRYFRPSEVLGHLSEGLLADHPEGRTGHLSSIVFARLELDACGAWVTLSNAGQARPIVVRQAGWIDVRGQDTRPPRSGPLLSLRDDRVGLGPGDALVICSEGIAGIRDSEGEPYLEEALPERLLGSVGMPATEVAERILAGAREFAADSQRDDGVVMVLRVPSIERGRALERVAAATGIPADQLELPGYPLGDVQPDLWKVPNPPREARINLTPEPLSVPALRRLLRRLLQSWRMAAEGDIELLASEVAAHIFASASSLVTVIVRYDGKVVRVEIGDGASARRRRTLPGYDELRGPGLLLVEALSSEWGVMRTRTGRRVWFEVPATAETEA